MSELEKALNLRTNEINKRLELAKLKLKDNLDPKKICDNCRHIVKDIDDEPCFSCEQNRDGVLIDPTNFEEK